MRQTGKKKNQVVQILILGIPYKKKKLCPASPAPPPLLHYAQATPPEF